MRSNSIDSLAHLQRIGSHLPKICFAFTFPLWIYKCLPALFFILQYYNFHIIILCNLSAYLWKTIFYLRWFFFRMQASVGRFWAISNSSLNLDWCGAQKCCPCLRRQTNQVLQGEGASSAIFWGTNLGTYSRRSFDDIL